MSTENNTTAPTVGAPFMTDIQTYLQFLEADAGINTAFAWRTIGAPTGGFSQKPIITNRYGSIKEVLEHLSIMNSTYKAGIFVTVNKTDSIGAKADNITKSRALFVDLDGAPLEPIYKLPHTPHLVVETSPGKYHAYWNISVPLSLFTSCQKRLAELVGGDPSVCDLPRIMRVPGFYHHKEGPFLSRIIHESGHYLNLAEIKDWLKPEAKIFKPPEDVPKVAYPDYQPILLRLQKYGMVVQHTAEDGRYVIKCPWVYNHTDDTTTAIYFVPSELNMWYGGFKCFHSHCYDMGIHNLQTFLTLKEQQDG